MTAVSMGNPHAIIYVDDVDSLDLERSARPLKITYASRTESTLNLFR